MIINIDFEKIDEARKCKRELDAVMHFIASKHKGYFIKNLEVGKYDVAQMGGCLTAKDKKAFFEEVAEAMHEIYDFILTDKDLTFMKRTGDTSKDKRKIIKKAKLHKVKSSEKTASFPEVVHIKRD